MSHTQVVYGPPGTGKTSYLIDQVRQLLQEGYHPSEIVYCSFTKAAAKEAAQRARLAFPQYQEADFSYFSTIHSICFRLLGLNRNKVFEGKPKREFAQAYAYDLSFERDDTQALPDLSIKTVSDAYEAFADWWANIMEPDFATAYKRYEQNNTWLPNGFDWGSLKLYLERRDHFKQTKRLWDFGDMILSSLQGGLVPPRARVLVVDESQDNSPLLMTLIKAWAQTMERVFIGGDAYQALFTFAGADPSLMMDYPADETIVLKQSYRCPKKVHEVAMRIVSRFKRRYQGDDFLPMEREGEVQRVQQLILDRDKTSFILTRTTKQLEPYRHELLEKGVPFSVLRGRRSPLEKAEGHVALILLRLMEGQTLQAQEIKSLVKQMPLKPWLARGAKTEVMGLAHPVNRQGLKRLGFQDAFMSALNAQDFLEPLNATPEEKRYLRLVIGKHGTKILENTPTVILGTVHSVKGKEADNVYLDLGMPRLPYENLLRFPDSEHRVFYVGVTRAKERLVLLRSQSLREYLI